MLEAVAAKSDRIGCFGNKPVVFRGLCASWPACRWDVAAVSAAMPNIRVSLSTSGTFPTDGDRECPSDTMCSNAFFRQLHMSPPHLYCHGNVLPETLTRDIPLPPLLYGCDVARRSIWISATGAISPLHYDLPNVLLCQVQGRKAVHLFPPALHDELAPPAGTFPALDARERIASTRRTDIKSSRGLYVEIGRGDALFMPPGWWHEIASFAGERHVLDPYSTGACVSIGLNWPAVGEAISLLAPWKDCTKYPILTQGDVLSKHYGPERARREMAAQVPGWNCPVF